MLKERLKETCKEEYEHYRIFIRWLLLASVVGVIVGLVGTAFYYGMAIATSTRMDNDWLLYALPLGGLAIVFLYRASGVKQSKGTNMVISAVRSTESIPLKMAPLIFLSTLITHLVGGSAGREGAALQIGGSLGHQIGRFLKLDVKDMHIITMCGMSAAFSALFGTPVTAAIFPMEVISVGIMYYAALVPCALASIIACSLAHAFGAKGESFLIALVPELEISTVCKVIVLAILCAIVAKIFCQVLHYFNDAFRMYFRNQYIRIVVGSILLMILAFLFGREYLGAGMNVIADAIEKGQVPYGAFLLKMIFTGITLGCGFKGGEIVPSFFIGATFGCFIGSILGVSPSFGAALGLMAVFCGVTNCPIASLFLSFELFGFTGIVYFLLVDAIAYMLSGYEGLYKEQKIMYSKFSPRFIDKKQ